MKRLRRQAYLFSNTPSPVLRWRRLNVKTDDHGYSDVMEQQTSLKHSSTSPQGLGSPACRQQPELASRIESGRPQIYVTAYRLLLSPQNSGNGAQKHRAPRKQNGLEKRCAKRKQRNTHCAAETCGGGRPGCACYTTTSIQNQRFSHMVLPLYEERRDIEEGCPPTCEEERKKRISYIVYAR